MAVQQHGRDEQREKNSRRDQNFPAHFHFLKSTRDGKEKSSYNLEWLPSQNGRFLECLQPHHATVLASVISTFFGAKVEPLCEPSQNGWVLELPQVQK